MKKTYTFEQIWEYMLDDRRMREFIEIQGVNKEGFERALAMFYERKRD